MQRKWIVISVALALVTLGSAVVWKWHHADSSVDSSAAKENPVVSPPTVVTPSPETAPVAQGPEGKLLLAGEDSNPSQCASIGTDTVVVSEDLIFRLDIVEGDQPDWTLPFDLQDGQTIELTRMGRNSDIQIASCSTKGRHVLCDAVYIGNDGEGPVKACPEVKLADASSKRIKLIARVRARDRIPLPADLEQAAIKSTSSILGWIYSAVSAESMPGTFQQDIIQFWSSAGVDAKLLGQVPAGYYFPPNESSVNSIPYYEQSGDRYLTDAFTKEGRVWISGVVGTPLEKMLDSVPPAICLRDYKFCTQPDPATCRVISQDPDDPKRDSEGYFEDLRFDKVLRTADATWISVVSGRSKTSLHTLYVTVSDFLSMKTAYCD